MQPLKEANIQKCLDLLEDFHGSVPENTTDKALIAKKAQAKQALDQLGKILLEKRAEEEEAAPTCEEQAKSC